VAGWTGGILFCVGVNTAAAELDTETGEMILAMDAFWVGDADTEVRQEETKTETLNASGGA